MADKTLKARVINKHEREADWSAATGFTPWLGEVIVYDPDDNHSYSRLKIGDGVTNVNELPFINENKVDKVDGKDLSTNDFTNEYKNQIDSHNFGENNTLNVETIGTFGNNNTIGCKAYKILKYRVDEANNKTYVQVDGNAEIANIPVGTPVTLIFDETATRVANTVNSIAYVENATEIVLNKAWVEYHYENTDVRTQYVDVLTGDDYDNLLIFPTYPSVGTTAYGGNGYVAGSDNSALMIYSTAFGKDNSAEGKYGMTIGRENAAGYAAFASGRNCKALGTHSHAEGSGSSVKEIEAGTTILGKHTIPANFEWNDGNGGHAEGFETTASNNATHAEGYETYAIGSTSHAEGFRAIASGDHSHAEGVGAWSSGKVSHAEGSETIAQGENAHAEGRGTKATGNSAHAEGQETEATKNGAHAEGSATKAYGSTAHAEGYNTEASGDQSHAQNYQTVASGWASTAIGHTTKAGYASQFVAGQFNENKESNLFEIGKGTGENNRANAFEVDRNGNVIASGNITSASGALATETFVKQSYVIAGNKDNSPIGRNSTVEGSQNIVMAGISHAEGESNTITTAAGRAHVEGYGNTVSAWHAHAEGAGNSASGANAHAEGNDTIASGENSHTEGTHTKATGVASHAEGETTSATSYGAHAEGIKTSATGDSAHAEGNDTEASGGNSHAEGQGTHANGINAHAEGRNTQATGTGSHAEGLEAIASGEYSHAQNYATKATAWATTAIGQGTVAGYTQQFVAGVYNDNKEENIFEVGNGTSDTNRKNAFEVRRDNSAYVGTKKLSTENYVDEKIAALVDSAPEKLNTLKELADALNGKAEKLNWNESDEKSLSFIRNRTHYGASDPVAKELVAEHHNPAGYYLSEHTNNVVMVHRYGSGISEWYKLTIETKDLTDKDGNLIENTACINLDNKFIIWGHNRYITYKEYLAMDGYERQAYIDEIGFDEFWKWIVIAENKYKNGDIYSPIICLCVNEYDGNICSYDIYDDFSSAEKVLDPRYIPTDFILADVKKDIETLKTQPEIIASAIQPTPVPGKTIIWIDTSQSVLSAAEEVEF